MATNHTDTYTVKKDLNGVFAYSVDCSSLTTQSAYFGLNELEQYDVVFAAPITTAPAPHAGIDLIDQNGHQAVFLRKYPIYYANSSLIDDASGVDHSNLIDNQEIPLAAECPSAYAFGYGEVVSACGEALPAAIFTSDPFGLSEWVSYFSGNAIGYYPIALTYQSLERHLASQEVKCESFCASLFQKGI